MRSMRGARAHAEPQVSRLQAGWSVRFTMAPEAMEEGDWNLSSQVTPGAAQYLQPTLMLRFGRGRAHPTFGETLGCQEGKGSDTHFANGEAGLRTSVLWTWSQHPPSPSPSQRPIGRRCSPGLGSILPSSYPNTSPNTGT